jgi:hypothetical protein
MLTKENDQNHRSTLPIHYQHLSSSPQSPVEISPNDGGTSST